MFMKHFLFICFFFPGILNFAQAQSIFQVNVRDAETKDPLIGATVFIEVLDKGASTDTAGTATITEIPDGTYRVSFSYVGYKKTEANFTFPSRQSAPAEIVLAPEREALEEIVVTATRTNSRIEDIPIRVEVIAGEELNEKDQMRPANISMLLSEATGIQPQQTSATNGNVSIRLLGLDGKYTQLLKDGFPLYSGFAQGLSIMQIPPMDLKQVEVIKGSSSSLYGSDAIAGIINMVTKQPKEKGEASVLLNQTSLLGSDLNGYFAKRWKKIGISILSANSLQQAVDVNDDDFSDMPKTQTFTVNPKLYLYFNPTTTLWAGVNGTFDNRKGGDMKVVKDEQPDANHQYFEENISRRISSQLKFDKTFAESKQLTLKNSINRFGRSLREPLSNFGGTQLSSYSEASYSFKSSHHQWVVGSAFLTEKFEEDSTKSHVKRDYNYQTLAFFAQEDWRISDKISLQAGIRTDHQNKFGWFVLPRLSLMHRFTKDFYVRAGSGLGYKTPTIFSTAAEEEGLNNIQPLSSSVLVERSVGFNLDANYTAYLNDEVSLTLNQSFFTTTLHEPLVLEGTSFVNKDKPIVTSGFESSARLRWEELRLFAGYTFVDARREYDAPNSFVPITPKHKLVTTVVYEKEENWMIGFEGFYTSSMIRDFDTDTNPYFIMGLILQKHFKHFTIIANCENITDQRQTRFENIVVPPVTQPSFRQIYAPLDGRVFNIAVRVSIL